MKDIVVGCITGYNFDKIKPWVNSLDRSGFTGTKAMICYNVDYDTVDELVKRDYTILAFKKNDQEKRFEYKPQFSIVVERFYHLWYFLKQLKGQYRYIITTDVKDVIFQSNPSTWLENNIKDKISIKCDKSFRSKYGLGLILKICNKLAGTKTKTPIQKYLKFSEIVFW